MYYGMIHHKTQLLHQFLDGQPVLYQYFFFISPLNLYLQMTKTKKTINIPILMLLANNGNTLLWIIYGLVGGGTQPWVCNSIGLFFSLIYLIWYYFYAFEKVYPNVRHSDII